MKSSHTPGPWISTRVSFQYGCYGHRIVRDSGSVADRDVTLASIGTDSDEDRANARLIASAPELLEALQFVSSHCDPNDKRHILPEQVASAIRTAIAKATTPDTKEVRA